MDYTYPSSPYYGGNTPGKEGLHNRKTPKNNNRGNGSSTGNEGGDIFFGTNSHLTQINETTTSNDSTALNMGNLLQQHESNSGNQYMKDGYGPSFSSSSSSSSSSVSPSMMNPNIHGVNLTNPTNQQQNYGNENHGISNNYHQTNISNSATYNDYTSLSPSSKSNLLQPLVQDDNYTNGNNNHMPLYSNYDVDDSHRKYQKKNEMNHHGFGKNRLIFVAIVSCCLFGSLLFIFGVFDSSSSSSSSSSPATLKSTSTVKTNTVPRPFASSTFSPKLEDNFMTNNNDKKNDKKLRTVGKNVNEKNYDDIDTEEEEMDTLHENSEPATKIRLTKEDITQDSWFSSWTKGSSTKHDADLHGPAHLHENKKKKVSVHREKPRVIKIRSIDKFRRRGKHHQSLSDHVKASEDGPVTLDIKSDTNGLRRVYRTEDTDRKALLPVKHFPDDFITTGSISFVKSIKGMKNYNHFDPDDFMGSSMTYMGIDSKTGLNVVAVSAPGAMDKSGVVYFLRLKSDGTIDSYTYIDGDEALQKHDSYANDIGFGWSITNIGDLNGDGIDDIAVGSVGYESETGNQGNIGAINIILMNENYEAKDIILVTKGHNGFNFPLKDKSAFGSSIAKMGDMDGDGVPDIAVGAWSYSHQRGAIFFLYLNSDGTVKSYKQISSLKGMELRLNPEDAFGHSMLAIGDLDGDGISELAVGADGFPNGEFRGAVFILWPNRDGSIKKMRRIDELDEQIDEDFLFGSSMATIGDLNGDGINEILVGCPGADEYHGIAYILSLNHNGEVQLYKPLVENDHPVLGDIINRSHEFSWSVTSVGDLNGDGIPDLMIGAELTDDKLNTGVLHVVHLQQNHKNPLFQNKKNSNIKQANLSEKNIRGSAKTANVQSSWF